MIQNHHNSKSVPKLKLGNSTVLSNQIRENASQLLQNERTDSSQMTLKKASSPNSFIRPASRNNTTMFLTPKEGTKYLVSPTPTQTQKALLEATARSGSGAFSDYYNKEILKQQNRLPSINNSNSSGKFSSYSVLQEEQNPRPKRATISNFDQYSSPNDSQTLKGKASLFKVKSQSPQLSILAKDTSYQETNYPNSPNQSNSVANAMSQVIPKKDLVQQTPVDSPQRQTDSSAFFHKQPSIKFIQEEQKRSEDSPVPLRSQRKRLTAKINGTTETNNIALQRVVLNDQLGGEATFNSFVNNLIYAMKKVEFFEVFFEEFFDKADQVKNRISAFLMSVFTDHTSSILASVQSFLNTFNMLTDSNIFELKAFLLDFLTPTNNIFPDKQIAFRLIENLEFYRSELTNDDVMSQLFDASMNGALVHTLAESLSTADYFSQFDQDKLKVLSRLVIQLLFNKISCASFITEFESLLQSTLIAGYIILLKEALKKGLSEQKDYTPTFRKGVSYQFKKLSWLLPSSSPTYISIVQNVADQLYPTLSTLLAATEAPQTQQKAFIQFIKTCYSSYNVFNMSDISELDLTQKENEKPSATYSYFCSSFKQALLKSKVPSDTAKKIEIFTLSFFE